MSEPLDPVAAGVASLLKSLRTRAGLQAERLSSTELSLDALTALDQVRAFVAAGEAPQQAIVQAVREAASALPPRLMIVADVSLSLELCRATVPDLDELYAPDLGQRRKALLANWDRLHPSEPAGQAPSPRALRLEVEAEALGALAVALTETAGPLGAQTVGASARGRGAPPAQGGPLPAAEKRVFGTELRKALQSRGLTARDAADALELSPDEIGQWESGKDFPSDEKARALDEYLTARGAIYALADELRAKAFRATHGASPPRLATTPAPTLLQVFGNVAHALRDSLTTDQDGTPQGWPHDLRQLGAPATDPSTAFGLGTMVLLEGALAADLVPVASHLLDGASGGYAALSQREPRPETTAIVLLALHRIDGTSSLREPLARMERNIVEFERTRPYILSTLLETSLHLAPDSELTATLIRDLLDARRPYGDLLLWPEKVEPLLVSPAPSIAHTARAVRALAQVAHPGPDVRAALEQAAAWLTAQRDLGNVSEIIERPVKGGIEQLYTRHFTAAWVVKALVSVGLPATHPAVSTAINWIWNSYNELASLWSWNNGDLPIWMTYDAIDALRLAALAAPIRRLRSSTL